MEYFIGIDEAGRGPVIGPMVMCGVITNSDSEKKLISLGVKDSKLILPNKRKLIKKEIENLADSFFVVKLSAKEIDIALNTDGTNLNWLEADTTAKIINKLVDENKKISKVYVDCPSNNLSKYKEYLISKLNDKNLNLIVEHKADAKYISASSASIIAKVTRDEEVEKIRKKINIDFGSGYPSDPKTIQFLEKHWKDYPEIFRTSWASYKKHACKEKQKKLI